jgi:hypothetical protein
MLRIFINIGKFYALAILCIFLVIALILCYVWFDNADPQGGNSAYCTSVELPAVPNGLGMIVTAHNTVCDVFGGNSAVYVHIHKLGTKENKETLVFRYSDISTYQPMNIVWTSNTSVRISVPRVSEVTKQLRTLSGVKIEYDIGKIDYLSNSGK